MLVFRSLQQIPKDFGPSIVTIGNFDGVHRGHQSVLAELTHRAHLRQARAVAVTFEPHPSRVLRPEHPLRLLTPLDQKIALLQAQPTGAYRDRVANTGLDALCPDAIALDAILVLPFTPQLSQLTAQQFAQTVLHDALHAIEVHEGENFRFGQDAHASIDTLTHLGASLGFTVQAHPAQQWRGLPISSSRIRARIEQGDMRTVRQLLGRTFAIQSTPEPGRGYGSRYTVPTINLAAYAELLPANGVYITCMQVDGHPFEAVTNIGNRPTFGADSFSVESHLLRFHPLALEESTPLTLHFLDRIRDEMRWPSPDALKAQIAQDIAHARHYFGLWKAQQAQRTANI